MSEDHGDVGAAPRLDGQLALVPLTAEDIRKALVAFTRDGRRDALREVLLRSREENGRVQHARMVHEAVHGLVGLG